MKLGAEKQLENTTKWQKTGSSEDPYAGVDKEAALLTAVTEGDIETVNNLIAHGAQVVAKDEKGVTALMFAIQRGHTNIAQILIKADADKESSMQALSYAHKFGQTEIAQVLQISKNTFSVYMEALTKKLKISLKDRDGFNKYFVFLDSQPLGSWKEELTNNLLEYHNSKLHNGLLDFRYEHCDSYLLLRIKCEQYAKESLYEKKELLLKEVENIIIKLKEESFPKSGAKQPYENLNRSRLIKIVYLSEDEPLTKLFAKYLPIPSVDYFNGTSLPRYIANKEEQTKEIITHFLDKNKQEDFHSLEKKITKIQRLHRARKRQKEEQHRIPERNPQDVVDQQVIDTFGAPYIPQKCSPVLAKRIIKVAGNVKFFNYIRHETKKIALTSIFNDGLYGRKTLLMFLQTFSPASLHDGDIKDGDANVVCFGSDYGRIDPKTNGDVELTFQFDKLDFGPNKSNHCAFFKQQDLGFLNDKIRYVDMGKKELVFNHTDLTRCAEVGYRYMHLRYRDRSAYSCSFDTIACLPNFKLISYDINNIESVLILNFFRYLDNLVTSSYGDASNVISAIYHGIEEMSDEELSVFLREIGRNLSDTMEFNFFGAHQIDFDALSTIKDSRSGYVLNMLELISELQAGKLEKLLAAKEIFPTVFQSYRFLDYLSSKTEDVNTLLELSTLRAICKTPGWYPMNEKLNKEYQSTKQNNTSKAEVSTGSNEKEKFVQSIFTLVK